MTAKSTLVVRPALESPMLTICSRQKTYERQLTNHSVQFTIIVKSRKWGFVLLCYRHNILKQI